MEKSEKRRFASKKMLLSSDGGPSVVAELTASHVDTVMASIKAHLEAENRIVVAYVHGSFLEDLPSHDVDVAVLFQEDAAIKDRLDVCLRLSSRLTHQTGIPVDVHALDPENLAFCFDALSGVPVLVRDEQARSGFEEKTVALYMDFQPTMREVLQDLAAGPRH